ncbi:uncharacterized protein [Rutidosis leptorrhynchoides]|uniref:uncharacterized protein n=1 Tax=Rutidosis leptorrhynchoides TaxID=125765 RepID=UPI003A9A46A8
MLQHLRKKFVILEHANTWMLKLIGKKVKNWTARLKNKYWDLDKSFKKQVKSRPPEMQRDHLKLLVIYRNNERNKELSKKKKSKSGQKGNGAVDQLKRENLQLDWLCFEDVFSKETNMDEIAKTLSEGSTDNRGPDDVFSKVMGNNKYGAVNMYGLGVRASDLWGKLPSHNVVCMENIQLKLENTELTEENVHLKEKLVGDEVFLHNILNPSEKVGRGWLRTLDPTEVIGGVEIEDDWCAVHLQHVLKKGADMVRPFDLIKKVEDATGVTIA